MRNGSGVIRITSIVLNNRYRPILLKKSDFLMT